ncbi:hypothetical protein BX616_001200 [Lobosporangium transversale]|nr:hypothetical protein BX616_001200 [Lobosporangium transversale]
MTEHEEKQLNHQRDDGGSGGMGDSNGQYVQKSDLNTNDTTLNVEDIILSTEDISPNVEDTTQRYSYTPVEQMIATKKGAELVVEAIVEDDADADCDCDCDGCCF